jgi:hypothetical protein
MSQNTTTGIYNNSYVLASLVLACLVIMGFAIHAEEKSNAESTNKIHTSTIKVAAKQSGFDTVDTNQIWDSNGRLWYVEPSAFRKIQMWHTYKITWYEGSILINQRIISSAAELK